MPIVLIADVPNILVVNNDLPAKDLAEFTRYAKANPGKLNFGSTGNGSSMHLAGELFMRETGAQMVHVPYNAPGTATTNLMANDIQLMFQLIPGIVGQVKGGKVRAIAVMAPTRSPALPDVPTTVELGQPQLQSSTWFALLAPKGTPPAIVARLNAEVNEILKDPAVRSACRAWARRRSAARRRSSPITSRPRRPSGAGSCATRRSRSSNPIARTVAAARAAAACMTTPAPTVGWIGLGNIGLPMARRVLAAGLPLYGLGAQARGRGADRRRRCLVRGEPGSPCPRLRRGRDDRRRPRRRPRAAPAHGSPRAAGHRVRRHDDGVAGQRARVRRTGRPRRRVRDRRPGDRRGRRRTQGALTSFVGGDADALARARPVLEAFCKRIVPCGAAGSGYRMKLVNQTIVAGVLLGLADGAALARAGGMSAPAVKDALGVGTASGFLFDSYLPRMVEPGGAVTFTLGMFRKDLGVAHDEAVACGSSTRLLDFAIATVDAACARHGARAGVQFLAARRSAVECALRSRGDPSAESRDGRPRPAGKGIRL